MDRMNAERNGRKKELTSTFEPLGIPRPLQGNVPLDLGCGFLDLLLLCLDTVSRQNFDRHVQVNVVYRSRPERTQYQYPRERSTFE